MGTLTAGVYTAPATVASAQTITVTAVSAANTSESATAKISLTPMTITVSPTSASLTGGQTSTIKATVTGASNSSVTWSVSPAVGTVSSGGVYTAPNVIGNASTVTVKATSAANTSMSASATISLLPVTISVSPTSTSLSAGQTVTIKATVGEASNTSVTWTVSPAVGTVSNGVYTAPATIASSQSVKVNAASVADPTKIAQTTITLTPTASVVSIGVTPSTASVPAGQSATFSATVSGATNLGVNWSISPSVGSIANGVYTAPSQVTAQQTVTVSAASAADATKIATAVVTLVPTVSVAVSPTSATLSAGQTAQFSASLSGTTNPNVTWSITPAAGSISGGLYQAPATVTSQQTVTVTATSAADPTKTSSATITLVPAVGVALTPSSISLTGGQSNQFNVSIAGTAAASTAVTWTLAPSVGTITNGDYTAPATISAVQTVTLTVASVATPTQTATATITLNPAPAIGVSPSQATLNPSGTQQFTATGLGTNPTWTISPSTGTITSAGLYSAPSSVTTQTTVTITATNASNSSQSATAAVTLTPPAATAGAITLPIEVIGPNGTKVPVSFSIPSGSNLSGALLSLQIHGLRNQTQASVQINGGSWVPINNSNVTILGLGASYGGIGGGFHTLQMTMPATGIATGANTVTFQFIQTDGRVSGFRVLAINVLDANGNQLIPSSNFVWDDPDNWTAPSSNASDITAGQTLFTTASLTIPNGSGTSTINAHCSDCHAVDGRDLKYFNYSNTSIQVRSQFHGLTAAQGNQIATYIRSLSVPNPGRPWNPPYQPGPGLDEQPVENWAAGAGLSAVLDSDTDMLNAMFPTGVQASYFSPTGVANVRETPIAMQLPDWNTWLPTVHPMDAWGSSFLNSELYLRYPQFRASLIPNNAASYLNSSTTFGEWTGNYLTFIVPLTASVPASTFTPEYIQEVEGTAHWMLVKTWELNQEFGLEGMAKTVFTNPMAEARAWDAEIPFLTSPNILHIPRGSTSFENGLLTTWVYDAFIWYHVQLVLNNSEYQQSGASPIDWGYTYAKVADVSQNTIPSTSWQPEAALFTLWQTKGLQISNNGYAPNQNEGWEWLVADISRSVTPSLREVWTGLPNATRTAIFQGLVTTWLSEVTKFTPAQFYAYSGGGTISASQVPNHFAPDSTNLVDRVWYMISKFKYWGVNQTQINQMAAWAQTIWPNGGWSATTTATCAPSYADATVIECNTDQ